MKKSLNILSSTLISNGHADAATSVNDLIKTLDDLNHKCHIKAAEESASANMKLFMDSLKSKKKTPATSGSELEKWNKIIEDYDKIPYRAEKFHEISESIMKTIMTPFLKKKKDLEATAPTITDEDRAISTDIISSQLDSTVTASDISILIKQANNRAEFYLRKNKLNKFAIPDQYIEEYTKRNEVAVEQFIEVLETKSALYSTATDQGFWSKMLHGDKAKAVAKLAGETPGFWARVLPGFGLLFSLPLALKNIHEAYINGKKIAEELPLDKYNINKTAALTGNPLLLNSLISSIKNAIKENEDDPENLYELLDIIKTISAYWLDLIFAITNTLMTIIDVLTVLSATLIDGPLPIADVIAGFFGLFVSLGLMGVEFASEHYVSKYWTKQTEKIKHIAEKKVIALGGQLKSDDSSEEAVISDRGQPDEVATSEDTGSPRTAEENMKLFMNSLKAKPATA